MLKQLENSLRVSDPSIEFLRATANDVFNIHLAGYCTGVDKVNFISQQEFKNVDDKVVFNIIEDEWLKPAETLDALVDRTITPEEVQELVERGLEKYEIISQLVYYDAYSALINTLEKTIETGETIKDWVDRLGKDDLLKRIGLHEDNPWYLQNVFRTNTTSAYNAGVFDQAARNENSKFFEYNAVTDERTTPQCDGLDGTVRPIKDSLWDWATPPLHYQCRSQIVLISKNMADVLDIEKTGALEKIEIKEKGIKKKVTIKSVVPENFRKNPAKDSSWLEPSKGMKKRIKQYLDE